MSNSVKMADNKSRRRASSVKVPDKCDTKSCIWHLLSKQSVDKRKASLLLCARHFTTRKEGKKKAFCVTPLQSLNINSDIANIHSNSLSHNKTLNPSKCEYCNGLFPFVNSDVRYYCSYSYCIFISVQGVIP